MDLSAFEANYTPYDIKQQAAQQVAGQKKSGRGGFLTSLISEGGAAGGALGGAAIGTMFLPGVGTAIGAGLGGLLGGFGGSAVEQKVRDDKVDWKKAAAEGVISGATSVLTPGLSAAKNAAKATGGVAATAKSMLTPSGRLATERASVIQRGKEIAGIADNAATPATEVATAAKPSLIDKFSRNLTKSGSGLKVGNNVGDVEKLDQAAQTFQRLKITGTPDQQLRKINDVMKSHSAQVDEILSKNPITVNGADVKARVAAAIDDPLKYAELDLTTPGAQRYLNSHLDKFAQAKTAKEVNDYVKILNKTAANAQGKLARGAALTDKETAALAAKKAGDEVLSEFPEIKPLKQDMAVLFERNPQVAKESEKTVGVPLLGVKSKTLKQASDKVSSNTGSILSKFAGEPGVKTALAKSMAAQGAARGMSGINHDSIDTNQDATSATSSTNITPASIDNIPQLNTNKSDNASDPMAAIDSAIQTALAIGDYKGLDALLATAAYYEKRQASGGADKPLSAEASKVIATANSGLDSLKQLEDMVNSGGVPGGTVVPGRGLVGGLGSKLLGTSAYDAAADNIADAIIRMRTGAAATKEEMQTFRSQLPQANDPPEVQRQKIETVRNYLSAVANRTGAASTDLSSAMGQ